MNSTQNTVIESMGVYLPSQAVSTEEILKGCNHEIKFPLENITGIKSRRIVGENEFSIDMAEKAVEDCLSKSKYSSADIDLLICCNISRWDGPVIASFEPCTSIKLKKQFGFTSALAFDITNACAGMFTAIYIANAFIKTGAIQRGMVVSGEYITHLTHAAQEEIEDFMDARLACLTLGDSAAALILEAATNNETGFCEFDLQTLGKYGKYCVVKTSGNGGFMMHTDSINLTDAAIKAGATHAINALEHAGWSPKSFQHLIMHQTSRITLNGANREINRLLNRRICSDENTINNLEQRGNTASTSHFVALTDYIRNNKINAGDRVVFSVSGSGLTFGTALYVFDDLPERLRNNEYKPTKVEKSSDDCITWISPPVIPRIRIESIGTISNEITDRGNSMEILKSAAADCLNKSLHKYDEIELLIYSGVYRSEYILEPAYATLLAGELNMNAEASTHNKKRFLAFDVFNSSIGFLNSCYIAQQIIASKTCNNVMLVAAECENNAHILSKKLMGIEETASAFILDIDTNNHQGFSRFLFSYNVELISAYTTYYKISKDNSYLNIEKNVHLNEKYIDCILPVVQELLKTEELDISDIDMIFPPQISSGFILKLSEALNLSHNKFIDAVGECADLFSSSLPYAMKHAYTNKLIKPGDLGLIISVGAGLQVGCATYYF